MGHGVWLLIFDHDRGACTILWLHSAFGGDNSY